MAPPQAALLVGLLLVAAAAAPGRADETPAEPVTSPLLERPDAEAGPTRVAVALWIVDVERVDSAAQSFTANVLVSLRWLDRRLANDAQQERTYDLSEVWSPGLMFANAGVTVRGTLPEVVHVDPAGVVSYRQRMVGAFLQPLGLRDFPFDRQTLRLHLISPSTRASELELVADETWTATGLKDAVGLAPELSLPDWRVLGWRAGLASYELTPRMQAAGYELELEVTRASRYYVIKVLLPLLLIVLMSWSVFWLDPATSTGIQIGVSTTSMLTLIAYRFTIDTHVPRVPYLTRLDAFVLVSTVLVFLTLVVTVLTARLHLRGQDAAAKALDRACRYAFPLLLAVTAVVSLLG